MATNVIRRDPAPVLKAPARGSTQLSPTLPQPPASTAANEFAPPRRSATEAEHALSLSAGDRVEQYEIIRELGRGGMGQVFLARDTRLGRLVAIKFLTRTSDEFVRRALIEAQTTARCTHENIVVIYETGTFLAHPYMVLEYLEGASLADIIADRALSVTRTIEIIVPVVRALTRAHQFGIVHRDLKPENIIITNEGVVKVLDFGVAKLFGEIDDLPLGDHGRPDLELYETLSTGSRMVGTLPFMSPEQFGIDDVDERTDLWAVGVILFRMLAGEHPLPDANSASLIFAARELEHPHRSLVKAAPHTPDRLARIVDRCLRKRKTERHDTADALLEELEALLPARRGRRLADDECPYPGLLSFGEDDADRFFGRTAEIARAIALLRDHTLLAIVGPSGAGKSSFVRAGVIPELKSSGVMWETFVLRPGRSPMRALPPLIEACTGRSVIDDFAAILRDEPGYLGYLLRERATQSGQRILVVIDQFEELFTLAPDADREAFLSVLQGIADDPTSPLRLIISVRSDFLHRVAAHGTFSAAVMRGLLLLGPPDRKALREALVGPAEKADYRFESEAMIDEITSALSASAASYPLLQFCLSSLWSERDRAGRVISHDSLRRMGGVAGALATHADHTISTLAHGAQRVARALFQRLVTSEGTRALVDASELEACGPDRGEIQRVLAALVEARLLVHHRDTETIEIIHEALVTQWPTLRRWMEEGREDTVFLEQVRATARQWETKGKAAGLVWRGLAATEAAKFVDRHGDATLAPRERAYLREVISSQRRAGRRKRVIVGTIIAVLAFAVAGSTTLLIAVRQAEGEARRSAAQADAETTRARQAEREMTEQLARAQQAERARAAAALAAEEAAGEAARRREEAVMSREQLEQAFADLKRALRRAEAARDRAEVARRAEQELKQRLEQALQREQERTRKLEEQRGKIVEKL